MVRIALAFSLLQLRDITHLVYKVFGEKGGIGLIGISREWGAHDNLGMIFIIILGNEYNTTHYSVRIHLFFHRPMMMVMMVAVMVMVMVMKTSPSSETERVFTEA